MLIREFMTTRVVTVDADDQLHVVREIFANTRFHHLLVVERDSLVGVISDRDLLRHLSPHLGTAIETQRDLATTHKRAHQIMSRHPHTLTADQALEDVVRLFLEHPISCVPIVDGSDRPVGIVTWRDLLRFVQAP